MKRLLFWCLLLMLSVWNASAQTDTPPQSTPEAAVWPKDTIDGVVVYRYTVQKSEGLYRISKNFDVSQEELVRLNPILKTEGLKFGQVIYVPVKGAERVVTASATPAIAASATAASATAATAAADSASVSVIKHVIQPKETLYSLSRRYGVSVAQLEAANPELSKNLPIGAVLLIPQKEAPVKVKKPMVETAEPSDKQDAAEKAVPAVEHQEQQPKADQAVPMLPSAEATSPADSSLLIAHSSSLDSSLVSALPLRLAYLLPLQVDAERRDGQMDRFIDFYEGALIAIYEAQLIGQKFDIYTYDVQKSDLAIQSILQKGEMQNMDAIIGPAYPAQVNHAALFAKNNRIPCVVPFTNRVSGLEHNPYLFQFNPTVQKEAEAAIRLLEPMKDSLRLVFVDPQQADIPPFVASLRERATAAGMDIAETTMAAILADSLTCALAQDKKNVLVFNSEKYSAVNVVMNNILNQKKGHQLSLFGRYSWATEKCPIEMVYVSIFHPLNSAAQVAYDALYQQYFGHEHAALHPRFDLLGYDLTKATIRYLLQCQQLRTEEGREQVLETPVSGLQSDIHYTRVAAEGGLENSGIQLIWQ